MKPAALLIHVRDWEAGFIWYRKAFPNAIVVEFPEFEFRALRIDDFMIEILRSDEKVASGKAGTVMYWSVQDLVEGVSHFRNLGAELYRGPIEIENGLGMCQFVDPFGNLIGIRGPLNKALKHDI
ncbi:glyoxalase [Gilvimarinus sp. SDUM040013]|nr:glyoxalase [Gilvimarinus sp. SDUM040013]MDO3386877.1 glyoxalase [Gilvimarinus sp. SDUM040013]